MNAFLNSIQNRSSEYRKYLVDLKNIIGPVDELHCNIGIRQTDPFNFNEINNRLNYRLKLKCI